MTTADVKFGTYSCTFGFSNICYNSSKALSKKKKKNIKLLAFHIFLYVLGCPGQKYIHFASTKKDGLLREMFTHTELPSGTITAYTFTVYLLVSKYLIKDNYYPHLHINQLGCKEVYPPKPVAA